VHGDFETRPSRTEQAGTIQLANKWYFVSELNVSGFFGGIVPLDVEIGEAALLALSR
jgi:hypothetical protein